MSQDPRLFFSRRIGLSDSGDAIPILGGTRLTGRTGHYSIGALNIQQRADGEVRPTNFTALRMQRDLLRNSDIGLIVLNKDEEGPRYNRVAGADANFRFGFLNFGGYAVKAFSPQAVTPGSGEDFMARASVNYQSRVFQLRSNLSTIGRRFNDEMGFIPRTGVDNLFVNTGWTFRPRWASSKMGIREIRPHYQIDVFRRRDGGGLESRYQDWHLPFNFNDGAFVEIGINPNVEEVRAPFTINSARGVQVAPGRYDFYEYFALWNSNNAAKVSWSLRYSTGDFYDGHRRGYTVGPNLRLSEKFNASVNLQINDIDLAAGSYISKLLASRVNYNFNTRMFLNALVQYNTDTRQVSSNLRFNFIHRPLSDFFLVYNERRIDGSGDLIDRAVIAKMTYLVAF